MKIRGMISMAGALLLLACGGDDDGGADAGVDLPAPSEDWDRDILSTDLQVDLSTRTVTATISIAGSTSSTGASFEVGDLNVAQVRSGALALDYTVSAGQMDIGVPSGTEPAEITIDYRYEFHNRFEGVMETGVTLTWPYWCGNMFPCKSDPSDGLTFTMTLTGEPMGQTAVYPTSIPGDAPAYMLAWAVGEYTYIDLGSTDAGTKVGVWYLPNGMMAAEAGTVNLLGVVDWLEKTYGSYIFGSEMASVSADWGFGAFGGMEHHPLFHVGSSAMADEETQAHEAAHGWFGNGVRIACWEDFVLSEGTVTYLAARSLEEVGGAALGMSVWNDYQTRLDNLIGRPSENQIAWPDSCNTVDILDDGLFNDAPYIKGAFFFRALELKLGKQPLDTALAAFYAQYKGKAARMQDLLDVIETETGYDPQACALDWLRNQGRPVADACP